MIKSSSKEIDGYKYEVSQFPAREAVRIQAKLITFIGDPIGQLIGGTAETSKDRKSLLDVDIKNTAISDAIKSLVLRIDEDQIMNLIFRMLAATTLKHNTEGGRFGDAGGESLFDNHFAGRLQSLYELLWFIVEVNYADFLSKLGIGNPAKEKEIVAA